MVSTRFSVRDVAIDIVGPSQISTGMVKSLTAARVSKGVPADSPAHSSQADITVQVKAKPPDVIIERAARSRRLPYQFDTAVTAGGLRYQMSALGGKVIYTVDLDGMPLSGQPWHATATITNAGWLQLVPSVVVRAATHEHANMIDYFTAVALTEVLEPLLWTHLLERDQTIIHAAAGVSPNGRGVAFTGSGQVGKTAIALGLVRHHGWQYLADDLVIIGADGMHRVPRPLRLAAHHLAILDGVTRIGGMSQNTRFNRSRRRIPITDVVTVDRLAATAPLDLLVNINATPATTTLRHHEVKRSDLVANVTAAVMSDFWEFLSFMNAAAGLSLAPAANRWHHRVAEIVEASLPKALLGIDVPHGADLKKVGTFIAQSV
ncbi:MAG: hypothetical protein WD360_03730 [Nitriliruptoraceae bacterium]